MAKKDNAKSESPENPLGQQPEAPEASNGTSESTPGEGRQAAEEIAGTYARARKELHDAMGRMRDEVQRFDAAQAGQRARTWVEENPTLAVFLAIGAGLLVGRTILRSTAPPPPPTLAERIRRQGHQLALQTRHAAHDVGDVVSEQAAHAVERLSRRAQQVGREVVRAASNVGDDVSRRAHDLGEDVARQAADLGDDVARRASAVAAVAAERAADLGETLARQTSRAADEAASTVRAKTREGFDLAESLLKAAKTVAAAFVVQRVGGWLRSL